MHPATAIVRHRLHTHHLLGAKFSSPAETVAHFGAVQAQDYLAALWALGLRTEGATSGMIEEAIADRVIVRTWPLRGTIHFVAAADARWLLELTAERTIRSMAGRHRQLELDEATFTRSRAALTQALHGGRRLARHAAYAVLDAAGISVEGQRGIHILGRLALEGVICIGPREGKQPTFVLLDEWVPPGREFGRGEALVELARRYFTGHGPATLADYTWWSGLAPADARAGLEAVRGGLAQETFDGRVHWFVPDLPAGRGIGPVAHLLPVYDEYMVAYRDRSAALSAEFGARTDYGNGIFRPVILVDGQCAGTWTRTLKKAHVAVVPNLFRMLNETEQAAFRSAVEHYAAFLGLTATLA